MILCSNRLSSEKLTYNGIKPILIALSKQCQKLENIHLRIDEMNDELTPVICNILDSNPNIQELEFIQYNSMVTTSLTDKFIDAIAPYLIGNLMIRKLTFSKQNQITDASAELLKDIASQSSVTSLSIIGSKISQSHIDAIQNLLKTPIDERLIPISSNTKSAAKSSAST